MAKEKQNRQDPFLLSWKRGGSTCLYPLCADEKEIRQSVWNNRMNDSVWQALCRENEKSSSPFSLLFVFFFVENEKIITPLHGEKRKSTESFCILSRARVHILSISKEKQKGQNLSLYGKRGDCIHLDSLSVHIKRRITECLPNQLNEWQSLTGFV